MAYIYGPQDASYMKTGYIVLVFLSAPVTLEGGTNITVGAADSYLTEGTTGFGTNLYVYRNGVLTDTDLPIPQESAGPWSWTEALPGTGPAEYAFAIWTVSSWNGVGFHGLYLTDSGGATGTAICAYGTQQKDSSLSIVDVGAAFIANWLRVKDLRWAAALVAGLIGRQVILSLLCSSPPPPDEDLTPDDFHPTLSLHPFPEVERKMSIKLFRYLWDQYCECKPATGGGPAPTGPGSTNITQPTWYVTQNNYTITNNDIANTLNLYLTLQNNSQNIDQQLAAAASEPGRCSPDHFEEGIVHDELVGEGRFPIGELVGFKIEAIERNISEPVLSGQPQYLWNMGWISTLAGELLLEEKRVTRSGYYWFPCSMQHATEFTYTLREYTKLRVTELVKPASIVLMG